MAESNVKFRLLALGLAVLPAERRERLMAQACGSDVKQIEKMLNQLDQRFGLSHLRSAITPMKWLELTKTYACAGEVTSSKPIMGPMQAWLTQKEAQERMTPFARERLRKLLTSD